MKRVASHLALCVVLLLAGLSMTGCFLLIFGAGAAAGVGTYAYARGESRRDYPVGQDHAWQVCQESLKELQMPVYSTTKDALKGVLKARQADGKTVEVRVRSLDKNITRVSVRVGKFGDKETSERIHKVIARKMGLNQ